MWLMKAVAAVIGGAFGKVVDAVVSLVMGSLLQPALKAANVDAIASWPAGAVLVALALLVQPLTGDGIAAVLAPALHQQQVER